MGSPQTLFAKDVLRSHKLDVSVGDTMNKPSVNAFTPEEIAKLPKWAAEKVKDLSRERDAAVCKLNEYIDSQTESPISIDEHPCLGESYGPSFKTRYIQARDVKFTWHGVTLEVRLRDEGPQHDNCIQLVWGTSKRSMSHVAFVPSSYQHAELISKENMR